MPVDHKLFTCPKCLHTDLGHDPLSDCPRCGFGYRQQEEHRWDIVVYFLTIFGLIGFLVVLPYYRGFPRVALLTAGFMARPQTSEEKLPRGRSANGVRRASNPLP